MNLSSEKVREQLADIIIRYSNERGLWPTIDFMVSRWIDKNPEFFFNLKEAVQDEKSNLQDEYGSNRKTKQDAMEMRRVAEVPEKIHNLLYKIFSIEIEQYKGGKKQFWRDFAKRYPFFRIGTL